jgi:hypothetical protein
MRLVIVLLVISLSVALAAACRDAGTRGGPGGGPMSDTVVVADTAPVCSTCVIEVGAPLRLGSARDRDIPHRVPDLLTDGHGHYYLTFHGWSDQPILRYDSAGRYVGRLGAPGRGPGEYGMTSVATIGAGDSIFVQTETGVLVFAPDSGYARMVHTVGARLVGAKPDGSIAMLRTIRWPPTADGAAELLWLDARGEPIDSFPVFTVRRGSQRTVSRKDERYEIASTENAIPLLAPDGSIWTYMRENYRLERHDSTGRPTHLFGFTVPEWGAPLMTVAQADSQVAATGRLVLGHWYRHPANQKAVVYARISASIDADGLIWVVRHMPAPRMDTIRVSVDYLAPHEAPGEATIPRAIEDRLYQTIIEVIDPKRLAVIARTRLPFLATGSTPGFVVRVTTDDDGYYAASVYRLSLRGPVVK